MNRFHQTLLSISSCGTTLGTHETRKTPDGKTQKVVPQTFMQKYWMYIIPGLFLTMNVLTGDPPPKQNKK
jgi:hypothetical protein